MRIRYLIIALLTLGLFASSLYAQAQTGELLPVQSGGKWGYIDKSGKVIIAPQYDYATQFSSGMAIVVTDVKIPYIGYIGASGQIAIKPENRSQQRIAGTSGRWGYIDKNGKYIWQPSK